MFRILLSISGLVSMSILLFYLKLSSINWKENSNKVMRPIQYLGSRRVKVLVLSYSRSGSSLLGDLTSIPSSSVYYREPLMHAGLPCEDVLNNTKIVPILEKIIGGIFDCNLVNKRHLRNIERNNCLLHTHSVIKTIRLHINGILPWIEKHPTLKIIHLIRDPRFQIRSRLQKEGTFQCVSQNVAKYCTSVEEDIRLGSKLSPSLYKLVRYEDLIKDPLTVMGDLYHFIGVNVTQNIIKKIESHFHSETIVGGVRRGRFSTFKESNFDNSKLEEIPEEIKETAKEHCFDLLQMGRYT